MVSQARPQLHVSVPAGRRPWAKLLEAGEAPGYWVSVLPDQFEVTGCTVTGAAMPSALLSPVGRRTARGCRRRSSTTLVRRASA